LFPLGVRKKGKKREIFLLWLTIKSETLRQGVSEQRSGKKKGKGRRAQKRSCSLSKA